MDEFLRPNANFLRLVDDWKKYGAITVGFDFDQTVAPFHNKDASFNMVISLLHELDSIGCTLECWTANPDHDYVAKYLKEKGDKPCWYKYGRYLFRMGDKETFLFSFTR